MILEIDAGNTAVKWRLLDAKGAVERRGRYFQHEKLKGLVAGLDGVAIGKVYISCVAGKDVEDLLTTKIVEICGVRPIFARTKKIFRGLTVVYKNPVRLGVDRWLAMLAAFHQQQDACCVIDCGSAITVDWVRQNGVHEGGYIVPGLNTMCRGLLNNTGEIVMEGNSGFDDDRWGQNTEQAVNFGIFRMSRTFLISVLDEISLVSPGCNFYITGGDASRFLADSTFSDQLNVKYRPDLVMDGLSVALGGKR